MKSRNLRARNSTPTLTDLFVVLVGRLRPDYATSMHSRTSTHLAIFASAIRIWSALPANHPEME